MKISCIGVGAMGGAIMSAICKSEFAKNITLTVSAKNYEHAKSFANENGCVAVAKNAEAVKNAKYVFVAVKPAIIENVLMEIRDELSQDAVVVSMAAGVTLADLRKMANENTHFMRIMPNMPAKIAQGMTALSYGNDIVQNDVDTIKQLLETTGKVEIVDEKLMDCITAVSGSSPAFVFMFIEALADAAVRFGMTRKQAYVYTAKTVQGSAQMVLESGKHPAALKDDVCSPQGTTIEGVASLEKNGFRNAVIEAVSAAYNKFAP